MAVYGYIQSCDRFCRLKRSVSLGCSFEIDLNCGCQGGGCGKVACYLGIKAVNSRYIDVCDHSPIILPKTQDQKSLMLR